jgi:E3 ubiquitin-protein ligase BRE1
MTDPGRDDVQHTTSYKTLLAQAEHLASEIARLESSNEKLVEENTHLLSERMKFKDDVHAEHKRVIDEANDQIQRLEKDLTRVRGVRDELHHELQNRKSREDETLHSAREISEIADIREVSAFVDVC